MKKLTCEMCGSTDIVKQEGVFVCQTCGLKYSVEDAKRMMADGVDGVTTTVKVDNTGKLDNLFKLARRAKDDNNIEKATQYYEQILLEDPLNWEAAFYSVYYSAFQKWRNDDKGVAINLLRNCIDNVMDIIKENIHEKSEQISAATEVSNGIDGICTAFYGANEDNFESFYQRYKEVGYSSNNLNLFKQCLQQTTFINSRLSEVYYVIGERLIRILDNDSDLDDLAKTLMQHAIKIAGQNPCDYCLRAYTDYSLGIYPIKNESDKFISEMQKLVSNGINIVNQKQEAVAKRRFAEYWDTHKSEKAEYEAEKKSLNEQIAGLNQEIVDTPAKTDGYTTMLELQKKVETLTSEKSKLGLFKLKEKKAIQEQIDSVNAQIAPVRLRIDTSVEAVKKLIPPLEERIQCIDKELTKPR